MANDDKELLYAVSYNQNAELSVTAMKRQQMYKTEEGRALLRYQEGATHHGGCGQCGGDK